ncbi:unnamed protein product [Gordionus sp. m RMFG-2023]
MTETKVLNKRSLKKKYSYMVTIEDSESVSNMSGDGESTNDKEAKNENIVGRFAGKKCQESEGPIDKGDRDDADNIRITRKILLKSMKEPSSGKNAVEVMKDIVVDENSREKNPSGKSSDARTHQDEIDKLNDATNLKTIASNKEALDKGVNINGYYTNDIRSNLLQGIPEKRDDKRLDTPIRNNKPINKGPAIENRSRNESNQEQNRRNAIHINSDKDRNMKNCAHLFRSDGERNKICSDHSTVGKIEPCRNYSILRNQNKDASSNSKSKSRDSSSSSKHASFCYNYSGNQPKASDGETLQEEIDNLNELAANFKTIKSNGKALDKGFNINGYRRNVQPNLPNKEVSDKNHRMPRVHKILDMPIKYKPINKGPASENRSRSGSDEQNHNNPKKFYFSKHQNGNKIAGTKIYNDCSKFGGMAPFMNTSPFHDQLEDSSSNSVSDSDRHFSSSSRHTEENAFVITHLGNEPNMIKEIKNIEVKNSSDDRLKNHKNMKQRNSDSKIKEQILSDFMNTRVENRYKQKNASLNKISSASDLDSSFTDDDQSENDDVGNMANKIKDSKSITNPNRDYFPSFGSSSYGEMEGDGDSAKVALIDKISKLKEENNYLMEDIKELRSKFSKIILE